MTRTGVVEIRLLGRLSVVRDALPAPVGFSGRRAELVFAYLVAERRRDVSRDELADALWPQQLPGAWSAALRGVVSDVRRVIGSTGLDAGEVLRHTGGGYRLQLPADTVVDVEEARSALAAARAIVEEDAAGAAAQALRAAELTRLPFLPRHEGEWVDGVRRMLGELHVEALEVAVPAHLRAGDARAATAAAARLVEAEPYNEAAYRLQIEVRGALGDHAGAARAFERCRARFAGELGVEPSRRTRAALERALGGTIDVRSPGRPVPPPAGSTVAGLSVLVVEDHDFQRRTVLTLLGRLGVRALSEAQHGVDALELLARSAQPDVIVCDLDMPEMDGVEFLRQVAEHRLAGAVVITSGLEPRVLRAVEAMGAGLGLQVLGTVEKPVTARRLAELLASYRPAPAPQDSPAHVALSAAELGAALDDGRIGARFVPIVDLQANRFCGAEAVATWQEDGGPTRFVGPVARADLAARLTDRVLGLACDALDALSATDVGAELWIPVAGDTLAGIGDVDRLLDIVRERDADPRRITLMVAEPAVRCSGPRELHALTRMRVKGFGACLDGVGAGRMRDEVRAQLPLTAVALAPAVVRAAAREPELAAQLEDLLESVKTLGLRTLARGCDEPSEYELLLQTGCRHAQGELMAGALALGELAGWARDWGSPSFVVST